MIAWMFRDWDKTPDAKTSGATWMDYYAQVLSNQIVIMKSMPGVPGCKEAIEKSEELLLEFRTRE